MRVLIVDDSLTIREILSDILHESRKFLVIAKARNGREALELVKRYRPDVITMDLRMPVMDGVQAIKEIMSSCPTPIVVITGIEPKERDMVIAAKEAGAVDVIIKPVGEQSPEIVFKSEEIIAKLERAANINPKALHTVKLKPRPKRGFRAMHIKTRDWSEILKNVVIIGASTGGPAVVMSILNNLKEDIKTPIIIAQHMPKHFIMSFANRLDRISPIYITTGDPPMPLLPRFGYVCLGNVDSTLAISKFSYSAINNTVARSLMEIIASKAGEWPYILTRPKIPTKKGFQSLTPSIDLIMKTAAEIFGPRTIGILLSGMGHDGVVGMEYIKEAGGMTIVQSPETCALSSMPQGAIERGIVDKVCTPAEISKILNEICD